jgi:hypothetical protein
MLDIPSVIMVIRVRIFGVMRVIRVVRVSRITFYNVVCSYKKTEKPKAEMNLSRRAGGQESRRAGKQASRNWKTASRQASA